MAPPNSWGVSDYVPMQRRLEESPMLNYAKFIDELVPPDTWMRLLFPNDVETRTKYQDTLTEVQLLDFYWMAIVQTQYAINGDPADLKRDNFTENLLKERTFDYNDVGTEFYALFQQAPRGTLQMWEYHNLDQDGGTKGLEDPLKSREDVFISESDEVVQAVIAKCGHLIPAGYFDQLQ